MALISLDNWSLENSYRQLPSAFYSDSLPQPSAAPKLVCVNKMLATSLGLDFLNNHHAQLANFVCGNHLINGSKPIAQAYLGHQFGHLNRLGDGRAHLLGEYLTPTGHYVDVTLKGSGRTAYSRNGDGRATLSSMLREYIMSEFMHALGIPTTRILAIATTGEKVQRETMMTGAVAMRIASSHLRVGTFELAAQLNDIQSLRQLADYTINRHYPDIKECKNPYLAFLKAVCEQQAKLITQWMRVGFIHGVMNSDNMAISGETIDYGPCAMMDEYHPRTVFSAIDSQGRYAFENQPPIAQWNLARLAESLMPLLHEEPSKAMTLAQETVIEFQPLYEARWVAMMRQKLGLSKPIAQDAILIDRYLKWMQKTAADYTNSFHDLSQPNLMQNAAYQSNEFQQWYRDYHTRLKLEDKPIEEIQNLMQHFNPAVIARNHKVNQALNAAQNENDLSLFNTLLEVVRHPYNLTENDKDYQNPPQPHERIENTFCGT